MRYRHILLPLLALTPLAAQPLRIYDAPDFASPSADCTTHIIYAGPQIPAGLDDQISSLHLAKRHQLVLAVNPDGAGPSRCYTARDYDLLLDSLPPELDNAASFLRTLPTNPNLRKKGTGGDVPGVNAAWYYNWGRSGATSPDREFVPMAWGYGGADPDALQQIIDLPASNHLLSFNEPDDCDGQSGQYYDMCIPSVAANRHVELAKTATRLGSPGCRENAVFSWLPDFMSYADQYDARVDFIAIHWYDWGNWTSTHNPNPDPADVFARLQRHLSRVYHLYRKPIWLTEFNANINRPRSVQDPFLQLALPYLEACGYIERYAYFQPNSGTGDFFDDFGAITSTGQIYRDQPSTPPGAAAAPYPWKTLDVGAATQPGATLHAPATDTWTVCGSGSDIWFTSDQFRYVYRPITGDGYLSTRVDYFTDPDPWAKAGLMIRHSLDPDAKHAMIILSPEHGAAFQYRTATSQNMQGATPLTSISAPYYVKLARSGNTLTGYISPDGQTWTPVASTTIPLPDTVYAGLAVTAHNNSQFCDAIFSNLTLSWPYPPGDLNGDYATTLNDFAFFAKYWLLPECHNLYPCTLADLNANSIPDLPDLLLLLSTWPRN